MALDQHYTPRAVADALVAAGRVEARRILDPAAGDGALLEAAQRRWSASTGYAVDIDPARVRTLHGNQSLVVSHCDFLSARSRGGAVALRELILSGADVAVLNPPFSARGGASWTVKIGGRDVACSRAMAFVSLVTKYVRAGGEVLALVPLGCMASRRDAGIRAALQRIATLDVVAEFPRGAFPDATAATVGIRLRLGAQRATPKGRVRAEGRTPLGSVTMVRGRLPVYRAQAHLCNGLLEDSVPFVHSRQLVEGNVSEVVPRLPASWGAISLGPSVLLPRVGKPLRHKLVLYRGGRLILSDCVYALEGGSPELAEGLLERLREEWDVVEGSYAGSCAKYLTLSRLAGLLRALGVEPAWTGPGKWISVEEADW